VTTVHLLRNEDGGIDDAFDDLSLAEEACRKLNLPLYEGEIAGLEEALSRIEQYMQTNPLSELDMAIFDAATISHQARERGVRRAARGLVEMVLADVPAQERHQRSENDPRLVKEQIIERLAQLRRDGFDAWVYQHGTYWIDSITTADGRAEKESS